MVYRESVSGMAVVKVEFGGGKQHVKHVLVVRASGEGDKQGHKEKQCFHFLKL